MRRLLIAACALGAMLTVPTVQAKEGASNSAKSPAAVECGAYTLNRQLNDKAGTPELVRATFASPGIIRKEGGFLTAYDLGLNDGTRAVYGCHPKTTGYRGLYAAFNIHNIYDKRGRLIRQDLVREKHPNDKTSLHYRYDGPDLIYAEQLCNVRVMLSKALLYRFSFKYDKAHHRLREIDRKADDHRYCSAGDGVAKYTYKAEGPLARLPSGIRHTGGQEKTLKYEFDKQGRVTSITVPEDKARFAYRYKGGQVVHHTLNKQSWDDSYAADGRLKKSKGNTAELSTKYKKGKLVAVENASGMPIAGLNLEY